VTARVPAAVAVLSLYRANIQRLRSGTEKKKRPRRRKGQPAGA
jgi:hypothetical protein